jgi:hypothetical protein
MPIDSTSGIRSGNERGGNVRRRLTILNSQAPLCSLSDVVATRYSIAQHQSAVILIP